MMGKKEYYIYPITEKGKYELEKAEGPFTLRTAKLLKARKISDIKRFRVKEYNKWANKETNGQKKKRPPGTFFGCKNFYVRRILIIHSNLIEAHKIMTS